MSISLVVRCAGRVRPSLLSGSRAACLRPYARHQHQISSRTTNILSPKAQPFSVLSARQNNAPQNPPPGPPQGQGQPQGQPQQPLPGRGQQYKTWILFNLAGLSAVIMFAMVLKSAPSDQNAVINTSSFSPFTITAKEQVSPTAFVISVRAGDSSEKGRPGSTKPIKDAWAYGLWSVEAKQPQLQIARHYTPLPPTSASNNNNDSDEAELSFLIRKLDGGEMSTYLSKLSVGSEIYLRGPHPSFDISRRLGAATDVVFLAGGTGVAPALQVARRLLEAPMAPHEKPRVSVLWANRRGADALGRTTREQPRTAAVPGWMRRRDAPGVEEQKQESSEEVSLARQIRELREKHPEHFRIAYFVDEEGSFIGAGDIHAALSPPPPPPPTTTATATATTATSPGTTPATSLLPPASTCPWHSPTLLTKLPDANDLSRRSINCTCLRAAPKSYAAAHPGAQPGANLVFVSGPDGFVGAYAGPKRWYGGGEMQGSVGGVLGTVLEEREKREKKEKKKGEGEGENWMVLKL